jgi:hypothetical protein
MIQDRIKAGSHLEPIIELARSGNVGPMLTPAEIAKIVRESWNPTASPSAAERSPRGSTPIADSLTVGKLRHVIPDPKPPVSRSGPSGSSFGRPGDPAGSRSHGSRSK